MYLLIYKTTHVNGKFYIGRHSTKNLNDRYFGSGKWVKSIKNKNELSREILKEANSFEELCALEEYYIQLYWDDPLCMNYKKSSTGADFGETNPMYGRLGELNPMFNRRGKDHPQYGKKHSKETSQKKRKALKNRSYEQLHGKIKAEELKNKLRKPKSEHHKDKLRTPKAKLVCRVCDKKLMTISNFSNWLSYQNGNKIKTSKNYKFIFENKILNISNLKNFCSLHNLSYACMKDVNKGKQKSHQGYSKCPM